MLHPRHLIVLIAGTLLTASAAEPQAPLQTAPLFTSGMVLQEGIPVPVWGWAAVGEKVTVRFAGQTCSAQANNDGRWQVRLAPLTTSAEGRQLVVATPTATTTFEDVLVGEVWLCSGQSNMAMRLKLSDGGPAAVAAAGDAQLRLFSTDDTLPSPMPDAPRTRSFAPRAKPYTWRRADPESAAEMSAVGWYFAQELRRELKKPVGLILASRGGTVCEAWVRREALLQDPACAPYVAKTDAWMDEYPSALSRFTSAQNVWKQAVAEAKNKGESEPAKPRQEQALNTISYASGCYNNFIAAIHPYALRGVLWYQGEGNGGARNNPDGLSSGVDYQRILTLLINDWRQLWGQEHLAFHIVQLASWGSAQAQPPASNGWAEVREAQATVAVTVPDSGLAVTIDIGDVKDIHPRNKAEVGRRLALVARARTYGQAVPCEGPRFTGMQVQDGSLRLRFDHRDGGLVLTSSQQPAFAVAGADHRWRWASARIDGDAVVLSSPEVTAPVAARYAWEMGPAATLFNGLGLPASPFRSDDWNDALAPQAGK